ncbi:MAG: ATP-grasp domain-containing protein [Thermoanaerobaculia bacterium]|nr:ATP-grasp domain-containing protein [Thermoanaerobaculia bacterium]
MVDDEARQRVLVLLETHWDRKQLAACRETWAGRLEIAFPEPDDVACPYDFDPLAFVESAVRGELGRIDGVTSSSDYPGATLAAAVATRLGLPGSSPERVLGASHKYYSRVLQREAVPEAVPGFGVLDARRPDAPAPLPFPFFLKPVKGAFSVLARRIDDEPSLRRFLASAAVREFGDEYMAVFNRLVAAYTPFEVDGHGFVAEELLRGELVTVEGFVRAGQVEILGIVDSVLHPGGSFARFDYPSRLPAAVRERMADVARRAILRLGLDATLFNIEMTWDRESDRVAIVEINPRICGQFADLYQKVDGIHGYQIALALCSGAPLRLARGRGRYAMASSVPLRVFEPQRVLRAPGPADLAAAEALFPETLIWNECAAGEALSDFDVDEDGASHRYAVVNLGGADPEEIRTRLAAVEARLGYRMEPLPPA